LSHGCVEEFVDWRACQWLLFWFAGQGGANIQII
jgi:hypothetical protein